MERPDKPHIQVGPEVDYFAQQLDGSLASRVNASNRRSRILRLVDLYHGYCAQRLLELERNGPTEPSDSSARVKSTSPTNESIHSDDGYVECRISPVAPPNDGSSLCHWRLETQTWDLLRRILPLRYRDNDSPTQPSPLYLKTRRDYLDDFFGKNPVAFERKTVLEWLQTCADSPGELEDRVRDLQRNSERGNIMAYGWIHTRSAIKKTKIIHAWPNALHPSDGAVSDVHLASPGTPLVTQLDPDAVTRQGRKLQNQDDFFESAIWIGCYELLRRGKSPAEISEWCRERTEAWRAVSISAFSLSQSDDREESFDPAAIILWRRMSYALARNGGADNYERAVYGILSGDIPSVEKVCRSWDDVLFAHYNALLRAQLDDYFIQKTTPDTISTIHQAFSSLNATRFPGQEHSLPESLVVPPLSASSVSSQHQAPLKSLQAAIVTGTLDDFMFHQGLVLAKEAGESKIIHSYGVTSPDLDHSSFASLEDHSALRVIAHVYLISNALEEVDSDNVVSAVPNSHPLDGRQEVQQNVVAAYATLLRMAAFNHLIPLYCSKLAGIRAYEVLSRNLIHIICPRQRDEQVSLMKKFGLEPASFVEYQTGLLLKDACDDKSLNDYSACSSFKIVDAGTPSVKYGRRLLLDFTGEDPETVETADNLLIRSMEWLLAVDGMWEYTFVFGTKLYKYFLGHLKLSAARALAERVSCSSVFGHKAGIVMPDDSDSSWFESAVALVCENARHGAQGRPTLSPEMVSIARPYWELECLARMIDITETLSALIQISREDPSAQREFWSKVGDDVKSAKGLVRPLLHQWLMSGPTNELSSNIQLREAFLPEMILAYVSILHFAGTSLARDHLLECMDLATAIADKDSSDVAAIFIQRGRMKELLEAFASCSKAIAIWGGEKKTHAGGAKRLKESGWSRELWSVNG